MSLTVSCFTSAIGWNVFAAAKLRGLRWKRALAPHRLRIWPISRFGRTPSLIGKQWTPSKLSGEEIGAPTVFFHSFKRSGFFLIDEGVDV
jgi:hypothetical protein